MRVVLVEDNELAGYAVSAALSEEGFDVEIVDAGTQVLPALQRMHPDALVLDISLPDVDGVTVARRVRDRWRSMPIIFATGHDTYAGLADALTDTRTRVLQKPYEIASLVDLIRRMTEI